MNTLAILTCIHGRPELTRSILRWTASIAKECPFHVRLLAVGSEGDASLALARGCGWDYFEHPNEPLSRKFQAGLRELETGYGGRVERPDAVMVIGSDDALTKEILVAAMDAIDAGADVFGLDDFFFCAPGPRVLRWAGYDERQPERHGEPMGCARTLSRSLLDFMGWRLWTDGLDRGLDGAAWARVKAASTFRDVKLVTMPTAATGGMALDVKNGEGAQLSSFGSYLDSGSEEVDWRPVLARFPEELVAAWGLDPTQGFLNRRSAWDVWPTVGPGKPRISLVMIARNAEAGIERAIRCALPVVDEIVVVVDTRTTDRTAEIAESLGALTFQYPWEGFAAQRNTVHGLAKGEWQLVLDADETLDLGNLAAAIDEAEKLDADAVLVTVLAGGERGLQTPQIQPRVLRAGRTVWCGRRHNFVKGIKRCVQSTAVIRNSYVGRMDDIAAAAIPELIDMFENPSDPNMTPAEEKGHAALHLSRKFNWTGDFESAIRWAALVPTLIDDPVKVGFARINQAWAILRSGDIDACETFCREVDAAQPGIAEISYLLGSIRLAKWYMAALQPGNWALIPQSSLAFAGNFPAAAAHMGFPVSVTMSDDPQ